MRRCVALLLVLAVCAGEELPGAGVNMVHNTSAHMLQLLQPVEPPPHTRPVTGLSEEVASVSGGAGLGCSPSPRLVIVSPLQDGVYGLGDVSLQCDIVSCEPKEDFLIVVKSQGEYLATITAGALVRSNVQPWST